MIGHLKKEIREQVGFDCEIVLPATHDTGSAVVAVPSNEEHVLYISSGTWSLMGTELKEADCGTEAMQHNFTNEGGYNRKYRFLKNIMGLWMVQSVKKERRFKLWNDLRKGIEMHHPIYRGCKRRPFPCTGTYDSRGTEGM